LKSEGCFGVFGGCFCVFGGKTLFIVLLLALKQVGEYLQGVQINMKCCTL
jgi:hypothetical protein